MVMKTFLKYIRWWIKSYFLASMGLPLIASLKTDKTRVFLCPLSLLAVALFSSINFIS